MKKVVNSVTTIFHYSLNGQLIAESDSAGTISAEYVYLNGQPLAKIEGVNTYYYHNDHLATPQKMTDSSGTVVWAADYKPFGEATVTVSTITNNLRFPGQYYDAETGTLYNYFRDYNPVTGKYIESDPIGLRGGINLYVYVGNNPLSFVDPYGLRNYTILDVPEPVVTPFEIYHFKHQFLDEVAKKKVLDPTAADLWYKLSKDYSYGDAAIDFYRFDVNEAIEHYKKKFDEEKKKQPQALPCH